MPQFYFADGAQQKGPLPVDQLRSAGVTPETLVWHEGMADWAPAAKVPELASLFAPPVASPAGHGAGGGWGPDERGWDAGQGTPPPPTATPAPGSTIPPGYRQIGPGVGQGFGGGPGGGGQPIGHASAPGYAPAGAAGSFAPAGQPIPGHGLSVASLVLGILSLVTGVLAFCMWWASIPLAVTTIILGHVGQRSFRTATGRRNGMATAGLVCGYIAVVLNAIVVITFFSILHTAGQKVQQQQQNQQRQLQTQPSAW